MLNTEQSMVMYEIRGVGGGGERGGGQVGVSEACLQVFQYKDSRPKSRDKQTMKTDSKEQDHPLALDKLCCIILLVACGKR